MIVRFAENIRRKHLFTYKNRLLLAISGGVDSVVLAHLLRDSGYTFALAHCNFKLRAADSEADEDFCRQLAAQLQVPVYVKVINLTSKKKQSKGQSIQMQARELRYTWFNELIEKTQSDYLLTAHHANDLSETILMNLVRGTGINGLKGIAEKNGNKIRPLLVFSKEEITQYAKTNNIAFRLDKSNLEDKYERNFLRHHVVPLLRELNPSFDLTLAKSAMRIHEEALLLHEMLELKSREYLKPEKNGQLKIHLKNLAAKPWAHTVLQHLVANYGFNGNQAANMLAGKLRIGSGQRFYSNSHVATVNRDWLIIAANKQPQTKPLKIKNLQELKRCKQFKTQVVKTFTVPKPNQLFIESGCLMYPLTIRAWQKADKFKPFGMKGFKLLSDFMRQEKMDAFEKENCQLLVNGNGEIIWVIGRRSDDRYKVNPNNNHFIKLTLAT